MPSMLKAPVDPEAGHVLFATAPPGAQATIPATVTIGLIGGRDDVARLLRRGTATRSPGATAGAAGAFANLAPGYYEVTFTGATVLHQRRRHLRVSDHDVQCPTGSRGCSCRSSQGFLTAPVAVNCAPSAAE